MSRLRAVRERRLMTQQELARKAGVTQHTISHLETGRCRPRLATIKKLAIALGVKPATLVEVGR